MRALPTRDEQVACIGTRRFNGGHASDKHGSRGLKIGANNECGAQAMAEYELRIFGKHPINFHTGITAAGQRKLKGATAPRMRLQFKIIRRGMCVKEHGFFRSVH